MLETEILGLTQLEGTAFPTVLLRHEEQVLFISIGLPEASAIQLALMEEKPARPMTHDLICNILTGLRGKLQAVTIYKLEEQTFFAYLSIEQFDEQGDTEQVLRIDSRPSDAIATALRVGCPVYVSEEVMDEAGHDAALLRPLLDEEDEAAADDEQPFLDDDDDMDDATEDDPPF